MTLNALVLIGAVYGAVELVEHLFPKFFAAPVATTAQPRIVGLVVVVAFAMTYLVGASVWAHEQVIGGHPLDRLSIASKAVVAVFVAVLAAGFDQGVAKTVRSIGQNRASKPVAK